VNAMEEPVVRDAAEEVVEVGIDDPAKALAAQLIHAMNGVLDRAALAEGIATVFELGFEPFAGEVIHSSLQNSIADGGDCQVPGAGLRLGDLDAEQRERPIAPAEQAILQVIELRVEIGGEGSDGHAVGAAAAAVLANALKGSV
jgi:hypothetical protein